ncbi:MAG: protein kinase domain-containing protein [Pirellulaceae bacterium]
MKNAGQPESLEGREGSGTTDPYATEAALCGTSAENVPPSLANRFIKVQFHAKGGLGSVFIAMDTELNRKVALKEIQPSKADNESLQSRFVLEAEITGQLEHPGIVPIYGLGVYPDGRPYYAMRFIEGESLKTAIARFHQEKQPTSKSSDSSVAFRKLLGCFVDVCQAVHFAHSRRVLHRDLKPDNIMLGKYGETLVVDWGLAKTIPDSLGEASGSPIAPQQGESTADQSLTSTVILDAPSDRTPPLDQEMPVPALPRARLPDVTLQGQVLGTPAYMSPEQAAGLVDQLGPATDVFSLGATLFHIMHGVPPAKRAESKSVSIPIALAAIARKAMQKRTEDRYPTALAIAEDVERYLADEPTTAHRESWRERLARYLRRHRTSVQVAAVALIVLSISLAIGSVYINQARSAAVTLANSNEQLANDNEVALREAELGTAEILFKDAMTLLNDQQLSAAIVYFVEALRVCESGNAKVHHQDSRRLRIEEQRTALAQTIRRQVGIIAPRMPIVEAMAELPFRGDIVSSDDGSLVLEHHFEDDGSFRATVLDGSTFAPRSPTVQGGKELGSLRYFTAGKRNLLAITNGGALRLYGARTLQIIHETPELFPSSKGYLGPFAISPNGQFFVLCGNQGLNSPNFNLLFDLESLDLEPKKLPTAAGIRGVVFGPKSDIFAVGEVDGSVLVYSLPEIKLLARCPGKKGVTAAPTSFSPDERLLSVQSNEGRICIWDLTKVDSISLSPHNIFEYDGFAYFGKFSPDGKAFVAGVAETTYIWPTSQIRPNSFKLAKGPYFNFSVSFLEEDGIFLQVGKSVLQWTDANCAESVAKYDFFDTTPIRLAGTTPNAALVLCNGRLVRIRGPHLGRTDFTLLEKGGTPQVSKRGRLAVQVDRQAKQLLCVDLQTNQQLLKMTNERVQFVALCEFDDIFCYERFAPKGESRVLRVIDPRGPKGEWELPLEIGAQIHGFAFRSADEVVVVFESGEMLLWDFRNEKQGRRQFWAPPDSRREFGQKGVAQRISFDGHSLRIACAYAKRQPGSKTGFATASLILADGVSGVQNHFQLERFPNSLLLSQEQRLVAILAPTGSKKVNLRMLDFETGLELWKTEFHDPPDIKFIGGGKHLLATSRLESARIWAAETGQPLPGLSTGPSPYVCTVSGSGMLYPYLGQTPSFHNYLQLWDLQSARAASPRFFLPSNFLVYEIVVRDDCLQAAFFDSGVSACALGPPTKESPENLQLWSRVVTGMKIGPTKELQSLEAPEWNANLEEIMRRRAEFSALPLPR